MSDRLRELQRQRALIQDHLAWLDREIAAAQTGTPAAPETPSVATSLPASLPTRAPDHFTDTAAATRAAEDIIEKYRQDVPTLQSEVKRGCLLYFFVALALLVAVVFIVYLIRSSH